MTDLSAPQLCYTGQATVFQAQMQALSAAGQGSSANYTEAQSAYQAEMAAESTCVSKMPVKSSPVR